MQTVQDDRQLVQTLANSLDKAFLSYRQLILRSFISGIFIGLGTTVGLSIVLLLLGLIAAHIPYVGAILTHFLNSVRQPKM